MVTPFDDLPRVFLGPSFDLFSPLNPPSVVNVHCTAGQNKRLPVADLEFTIKPSEDMHHEVNRLTRDMQSCWVGKLDFPNR